MTDGVFPAANLPSSFGAVHPMTTPFFFRVIGLVAGVRSVSEGLPEVAPVPLNASGNARIRHWLRTVLGLDRAVGFTVLARFWGSAAGLVTVLLIARFLSPAEQGYYYTFGSLVAMQMIFELGFSFVILQMASHERARLSISADYEITGNPAAHARLASVIQKSVRWYSIAAVLLAEPWFLLAFTSFPRTSMRSNGPLAFSLVSCRSDGGTQLPNYQFLSSWKAADMFQVPVFASCNPLSEACWRGALWKAIMASAPSMMLFGMASSAFVWLVRKRKLLLRLSRYQTGEHRIRWAEEVWPFQWKIAVSWFCGYFIFWLFNPVLFAYRGPVEAGQMGMSLSW